MSGLIRLDDRSVVAVSGDEAAGFLQGIVTNSVDTLAQGHAAYAGLLMPQGKLLFDFFVLRTSDAFLIDIASSIAADFVKRLTFYKLRAKIDIRQLPDAIVCADLLANAELPDGAHAFVDPRTEKAGVRVILPALGEDEREAIPVDAEAWLRHRLDLALPEGGRDFVYGDCFPHDIAMDQLNGIAFSKGCYVGQEVVSRMRHRGTARRRPMTIVSDTNLPPAPCDIAAEGKVIGRLGSAFAKQGLAEIRIDFAEDAVKAGKQLLAEDKAIQLRRPAWARYAEELASVVDG